MTSDQLKKYLDIIMTASGFHAEEIRFITYASYDINREERRVYNENGQLEYVLCRDHGASFRRCHKYVGIINDNDLYARVAEDVSKDICIIESM